MRNPVTTKKFYRLYVINKLPQVRLLDFQKVRLKVNKCPNQLHHECFWLCNVLNQKKKHSFSDVYFLSHLSDVIFIVIQGKRSSSKNVQG